MTDSELFRQNLRTLAAMEPDPVAFLIEVAAVMRECYGEDTEAAKKVAAAIKEAKLPKVQASIQADQVRVTSPSRDTLQEAIQLLRSKDFGVELKFGNYR